MGTYLGRSKMALINRMSYVDGPSRWFYDSQDRVEFVTKAEQNMFFSRMCFSIGIRN